MASRRTITIINSGERFDILNGETILEAARRNGIELPFGCGAGVCGVCIGKIEAGKISYPDGLPMALFEEDMKENRGLCCVGTTTTDLEIDIINFGQQFEAWE